MKQLHHQFEDLICRLLLQEGFSVTQKSRSIPGSNADLSAEKEAVKYIIEVKLYRSAKVSTDIIQNAIRHFSYYEPLNYFETKRILIISASLDRFYFNPIGYGNPTEIWDYSKLKQMLAKYPDLDAEFENILREALPFYTANGFSNLDYIPFGNIVGERNSFLEGNPSDATSFPKTRKKPQLTSKPELELKAGSDLLKAAAYANPEPTAKRNFCKELNDIPSGGHPHSKKFEEKCTEILQQLFGTDLTAWKEQSSTNTGLHRFDLIARVASKNDFWSALITDYRSRYIVFEFKNYNNKISQGEIYSTEKYLYPTAMRGTAIIITRSGANDNAVAATYGSLRETGKVILVLTIDDLCKMLALQEQGDEPSEILSGKLDAMMMNIER